MKKLLILLITFTPFLVFSQKNKACRSAIDFVISPDYFAPPKLEADASFTPTTSFRAGFNMNIYSTPVPYFVTRIGFRYVQYNMDIKPFFSKEISHEKYEFLEVPLIIRSYFGLKTWRLYVEAHIGANLSVKKSNTFDVHFTGGGALGVEYSMSKKLAFFLQPTFRKPLFPSLNSKNDFYAFSTGLEMGVKYKY